MGHASIVQRNWVPCAQPNFACVLVSAPVASFKVVRFRRALSSTSGLSSRFRVTNQTRLSPMKMLSPQSRYSGNSDGGESDSDGRSGWSPRDKFGLYPWDPSWDSPERDYVDWVREDTFTFFTTDGLVRIGGSIRPSFGKKHRLRRRRYKEEDYMDPKQGLCLGAIFDIAATNVVIAEKATTEGLHEKLTMMVVMPLLWGVPPAVDTLNYAIRSGGGIVEKTYKQWHFL
uniref:DUF7811 domain-containing protein n=1 Tax=Physcomitrium patens TaxID=3218 RepID=A0A7I4DYJ6_PHYPA